MGNACVVYPEGQSYFSYVFQYSIWFPMMCHIPLLIGKAETRSFVRCHAMPCSAGAPASRNTARSIVHLIRTLNCFSHTQGYGFPSRIIKEKNPPDPSQDCSLHVWPLGWQSRVDGQEEDAKGWSIPSSTPQPARVHTCLPLAQPGWLSAGTRPSEYD